MPQQTQAPTPQQKNGAKTVQRPQQRKLEERPKVTFQRQDAILKEEESSEDESDDEEADPQHDGNKEARHDARCYKCDGRNPVWILHLQPERTGPHSGSNVHVSMDSHMAGCDTNGGP